MILSAKYIKACALRVGFHDCGIARAKALEGFREHLDHWLDSGHHGTMAFMEEHREKRSNPQELLPDARSVISLVLSYKPTQTLSCETKIATYAYGKDYHERIKSLLFQLIAAIRESYPDFEAKPCVDTVPISDKWWARQAGLGWIGNNTLLIHPRYGSFVNLAELVTTAEADHYDVPLESRCDDCTLCQQACPNGALRTHDGVPMLDARSCTSYNTIENRADSLPSQLHTRGYVFGCDICQNACPFNRQTPPMRDISDEQIASLSKLIDSDEATFKKLTKHSAMNRIKRVQWLRNIQFNN